MSKLAAAITAAGLAEADKKIPEDVTIIGFDNIPAAAYLAASLHRVKAPVCAMLEMAIERYLLCLKARDDELRPAFILRESIKSIPL